MTAEEKKEYLREYNLKNKEILAEKRKLYYLKNKERLLKHNEEYRKLNIDKVSEKQKERYLNNKDKILEKSKQYRLDNLERCRERDKIRSRKRPRKGYSQSSTYNITNAERHKEDWLKQELTLYKLKILDIDGVIFYKYGLTKDLKQRLEKIPYKVEIVKTILLDKYEATYLEYKLLQNVKKYKPLKEFKGYTECFIS